MVFSPNNMTLWSNTPVPPRQNLPQLWGYYAGSDTVATVTAADYFNKLPDLLISNSTYAVGDEIYCVCSDGNTNLYITALTPNVTTAVVPVAAGSVAAASIVANSLSDTQMLANGISGASLALSVPRSTTVAVTAAEFKALYDTPKLLIAAPGASKTIVVTNMLVSMTYVSAQYTTGGAVAAQYDSTVHGAGTAATATIAAATINGWSASSQILVAGALASSAQSTVVNKGLYLSNATADFAAGDSTFNVTVNYYVASA